jgi:hypothetical protein
VAPCVQLAALVSHVACNPLVQEPSAVQQAPGQGLGEQTAPMVHMAGLRQLNWLTSRQTWNRESQQLPVGGHGEGEQTPPYIHRPASELTHEKRVKLPMQAPLGVQHDPRREAQGFGAHTEPENHREGVPAHAV